ncbi:MAG TPA: IreB family regulatory phosphoprotein [Epulopiscium sp.]|nr:IreB family regulatory phosphoprotein [Candidatus Epulonipiscium sp.]
MEDIKNINETMQFSIGNIEKNTTKDILNDVYVALKEKGYNPINQIVGYIISGDPTYITSHNAARTKIRKLERDEILEELVTHYLECK